MKKSLFTLVFAIGLAMGFIPVVTRATTLENIEFFVDADSAKGLDGKVIIDFSKSGSNYNGTLYLPGSAAVDNLKLSWNGTGVTVKIGGSTYVSGNAPIPAVGATTTYTVTADNGTASYSLKTMKGSGTVKAMFFNIDESKGTVSAMNSDRNHDTKCYGSLTFDGQTNYMTIKGRGNTTWREFDKKPYNITIFKKDDYADKKKV